MIGRVECKSKEEANPKQADKTGAAKMDCFVVSVLLTIQNNTRCFVSFFGILCMQHPLSTYKRIERYL
jgi:hypothetical protein